MGHSTNGLRSMLILSLFLAGSLLGGNGVIAEEIVSAELSHFTEKHNPEVNVSGHIIVGLMAQSAHRGLQEDRLTVAVLDGHPKVDVCLKVTSQDGAYVVNGAYTLRNLSVSEVHLPYPTKQEGIVSDFTESNVAITVTDGSCATMSNRYFLPGLAGTAAEKVRVLVNGFDATDVYFEISSEGNTVVEGDCSYLSEGRHTAYNFTCDIPLQKRRESSIVIIREVYGRELPELVLTLVN